MLNNILKLKGAQKLSKTDQKSIQGGGFPSRICPVGTPAWMDWISSQYECDIFTGTVWFNGKCYLCN